MHSEVESMKRLILGLLWIGGVVALSARAGTITIIQDCNACLVSGNIGGFGTTIVAGSALAESFQSGGSGQVMIDFQGYTTGPLRDGFIYINATADSESFADAFIDVDSYRCGANCDAISEQFLPVMLGTIFNIEIDAAFFTFNNQSGGAIANLQFSMYEDVGMADDRVPFVGSPVIIYDASMIAPEPASSNLVGGAVGLFVLARWTFRPWRRPCR
jgi:hypothetical protein